MCVSKQMKYKEAVFECINRLNQPLLESRMMWIIDINASDSDWINLIDKITPVTIWEVNDKPKRKPKFQKKLIEVGDGRLAKLFNIFLFIKG